MSFFVGYKRPFLSEDLQPCYACVIVQCFVFPCCCLDNFSLVQRVEPRLGCFRIFFSGFRCCFSWVDDWSPSTALGSTPQTPSETSPIFFIGCTVAEFQNLFLFNPSFWVSVILPLLLFFILHFSVWNLVAGYFFVCVCYVLGVALFWLSSFFCWDRFRFW